MKGRFAMRGFSWLKYGILTTIACALLAPEMAHADAAAGKQIFAREKCIACHRLAGQKGKMAKVGGSLDGVGNKRAAAWIKRYVLDPKSEIPTSKMEPVDLPAAEVESL